MSQKESGGSDKDSVGPQIAKRRQDALGRGLERIYEEVLNEPVPDDFLKILGAADAAKPHQKPQPNGAGEAAQSQPARKQDRG